MHACKLKDKLLDLTNTWSKSTTNAATHTHKTEKLHRSLVLILTRLLLLLDSVVLEDAVEIDSKKNSRQEVGRILLKGDSITLLQVAQPVRQQQQA